MNTTDNATPRLLTRPEAAKYLNVSVSTLHRSALAPVRIGRAVRFDPADLDAFIKQRKEISR